MTMRRSATYVNWPRDRQKRTKKAMMKENKKIEGAMGNGLVFVVVLAALPPS